MERIGWCYCAWGGAIGCCKYRVQTLSQGLGTVFWKDTSKTLKSGESPRNYNSSFRQKQLIFKPQFTNFKGNCLLALAEALVSLDSNKFNLLSIRES